ncbi:hypothetical protein [Haladaptatus sp. DYSN1]|uniref:hypothetical protein n=1 Tax=unclassified Haladaptatus TaxID=2622732 RepID=UPI0024056C43|nr:hypothetical protein [Haladaptatus sp. DYSN1]
MAVTESTFDQSTTTTMHRVKRVAFYLVVLVTLGIFVFTAGELLPFLVLGFTMGAELGIHQFHVIALASFVAFVTLGVLVQLYKPETRVATYQATFLAMAILTALSVFTGDLFILLYFVPVALIGLLHPAGRRLLTIGERYSPAILGLTLVAAIPLLAYAGNQFQLQATGDEHALFGHYMPMVAIALTILATGLLVAFESVGFRLLAWLTGLFAVYVGFASIVLPTLASSAGTLWGALAIVWAVAFVAATELSVRESASSYFSRVRTTREESVPGKPV